MSSQTQLEERVKQIYRCMREIEKCEADMKAGNTSMGGAWLGYMDWLEELHYQVHTTKEDVWKQQ